MMEFCRRATKADTSVSKRADLVKIRKPVAYCEASDLIHHIREELGRPNDVMGDQKVNALFTSDFHIFVTQKR